jgi:phosphohistidine phosphatase
MLSSYSQLLVLVRHGRAKSTEEDPTRPLSVTGRQQAESMANWLGRLGPQVDEVWHSGKPRARQTAEILARGLDLAPARVRKVAGLAPADEVEPIAGTMEADRQSVMLVGHLPFLNKLASRLLTGDADRADLRFAEVGAVVLARNSGRWLLVALISPEMCQ